MTNLKEGINREILTSTKNPACSPPPPGPKSMSHLTPGGFDRQTPPSTSSPLVQFNIYSATCSLARFLVVPFGHLG